MRNMDNHLDRMSNSRDILLFSTAEWDHPFWTNKQHMAGLFAQNGYRVLYIDSLGLRKPAWRKKDLVRIARRIGHVLRPPQQVQRNIWQASPLVLPWHNSTAARLLNPHLLKRFVRFYLMCCRMPKPLIWTYNPLVTDLCANLPHSGIVYHCVDNLTAAPKISGQSIQSGEEQLARIADLCFTTSPLLYERMRPLFKKTVYEANVCDPDHFGAARKGLPEPEDIKGIAHPRIVLIGALSSYKVDFALIQAVAKTLPQAHWLLIGEQREGEPDSIKPPVAYNIHLMGPRPYASLPAYLAHCDVAVIPAPHNSYTAAMFPMKFFEYLAAGLPVVSTALPALQDFGDLCFFADGPQAFAEALRAALAGERRDAKTIEKACAHFSWKERFKRMEKEFLPLVSR
ncbi:glycosyltransferase [Desulfovibrio sp. OttesenSCG-928-F20]|nr:glycosyltransferase [Desulfovibrio sp. OttesenSCG-928-F20]